MTMENNKELNVLILAAGLGTRMKSNLAKVLHELDGRPLINHVCRTASALAPSKIFVVVGHQAEQVRDAVLSELDEQAVEFVRQESQLGTGDAVNSARGLLENSNSTLLVLSGDVPMIRAETLAGLVQQHNEYEDAGAACSILTVHLDDPSGYGRVVRDIDGNFRKIVEQKDGNEEELAVAEINSGIYCFDTLKLFRALTGVRNDNAQGEYYLTDVPRILLDAGERVSLFKHDSPGEIEGINNRKQLASMERDMRLRTVSRLMLEAGVTFIDPYSAYVSESAKISSDTVIYPNVTISGNSEIGSGCIIRSGTRISDSVIGAGTTILDHSVITNAEVGENCNVGPFAHLRPKARMMEGSKVGNFVEMKNTTLGVGSKANHLTYLGDAVVGENSNIGAGTITCNYDGKNKHATKIGDRVKIGSDTMLVAPVEVGSGSVTGAGSVVTKNIAENKLVVGAPARAIRTLDADE
ncbi:MAG: bifunctional UDP-N-acetylglucosamine diphosphorylase/glucosamine-1-phosphate N-acetyltransferase GlmU [Pyrinomonadaceae bacterium]